MKRLVTKLLSFPVGIIAAVVVGAVVTGSVAYSWYFADRIAARTVIGSVAVGGLTKDEAAGRLQVALDELDRRGIQLIMDGTTETIQPAAIGLDLNLAQALDTAFERGHQGAPAQRLWERFSAWFSERRLDAPIVVDSQALTTEIGNIALASDVARRDLRLSVQGHEVTLLTDTAPGKAIDREDAAQQVVSSLKRLDDAPVVVALIDDPPRAEFDSGPEAVAAARAMVQRALTLRSEEQQFTISRDRLGSWIISEYAVDDANKTRLVPELDRELVAQYVITIAKAVNIDPVPPQIFATEGRVTGFVPPKVGRSVEEDKLVDLIIESVTGRAGKDRESDVITVPLHTTKLALTGLDADSGITELIGSATTTFAGSPKNRIANIKNGVKFLSGALVQPGDEFSALATLGTIDNTTGYLPELVIKGDRTIPEFGGGLCQVSTTLFRAVMDAALPITARRNHSYRVGYYEKDGDGKFIGPGLDATIYEPDPDFRFRNDMATPVLIIGYVSGTTVTFELYGTGDGRTSHIDGPTTLTETSAGEAVYIETLDLAPGVVKQVEFPHPGGSTTATYSITYPDGRTDAQEFKSWYRKWPAKYLKGVSQLSSPGPTPPVTAPFDMP